MLHRLHTNRRARAWKQYYFFYIINRIRTYAIHRLAFWCCVYVHACVCVRLSVHEQQSENYGCMQISVRRQMDIKTEEIYKKTHLQANKIEQYIPSANCGCDS